MQPTELCTLRIVETAPSPAAISSNAERIADMVGSGAAILLRHQHAHEAEPAELGQRLFRETRLAIPFRRMRREQALRDLPRRVTKQPLFLGQSHSLRSKKFMAKNRDSDCLIN